MRGEVASSNLVYRSMQTPLVHDRGCLLSTSLFSRLERRVFSIPGSLSFMRNLPQTAGSRARGVSDVRSGDTRKAQRHQPPR